MKIDTLSLVGFTLLMLFGCQTKLKPVKLDILGTESCQPPCWRGIIPGETTADETINIFENWQVEGKGIWKRYTGSNEVLHWDHLCWLEKEWPEICLEVDDNLISEIDLRLSSSSLKLKDMINKYRQPDGYTLELCPDCSGYGIGIYYPEIGLFFIVNGKGKLQIEPEMSITKAVFFKPTDREGMINLFFGKERIEDDEIGYEEWPGYGLIHITDQ